MASSKTESKSRSSRSAGLFSKALDLAAAAGLFLGEIKSSILEHWDWVLRRVEYIFIVYLWISAGIFLLTLGLFDLLIDKAGIPRGVVFSLGGFFVTLIAVIFLQAAKIKKYKR
jgi:fucose permease